MPFLTRLRRLFKKQEIEVWKMWAIASNSHLITQLFCDGILRRQIHAAKTLWPHHRWNQGFSNFQLWVQSNCESRKNVLVLWGSSHWGCLLPVLTCLGVLHVVILGRMRLYLILRVSSPIIHPLVFGVGPKGSAGLEASRLIGDIVAGGMIRYCFVVGFLGCQTPAGDAHHHTPN